MHRTIALLLAAIAATITVLAVTPAHAVQRTHVSAAIGVDTNTATGCTPVAPCRTFQAAMTVTDVNGEVVVLDSGGYGAVTITQSVALIAPTGVYAGISVFPGATGVTIATPGINVVLRGLTINGQGGFDGIAMTAGNKLTIENCVISNLAGGGISVSGITAVRIVNTIVRDNRFDGVELRNGVRATITGSAFSGNRLSGINVIGQVVAQRVLTTVDIANSTMDGNGAAGIKAFSSGITSPVIVSVRDSSVMNHSQFGMQAAGILNAATGLSASNNIVSNNSIGISARSPGTKVWVSGNTVINNNVGFEVSESRFASAGNNALRNNITDIDGTVFNVGTR